MDNFAVPDDARELDADRDAFLRELAARRRSLLASTRWAEAVGRDPAAPGTGAAAAIMAGVAVVCVLSRIAVGG